MTKTLLWVVWCLATLMIGALSVASPADDQVREQRVLSTDDQLWEYLKEPPKDSAQAQDRRVWLAQEQADTCLMEVSILDSVGSVVRHFVSRRLHPHYCSVYWDCKDDSGRWVPAGPYTYVTNDCGGKRTGKLRAAYKSYETTSFLYLDKLADSGLLAFEIPRDSLRVTLGFYDRAGSRIFVPIRDSLMMAGRHVKKISQIRRYIGGVNTIVKLQVEDATVMQRFRIEP